MLINNRNSNTPVNDHLKVALSEIGLSKLSGISIRTLLSYIALFLSAKLIVLIPLNQSLFVAVSLFEDVMLI